MLIESFLAWFKGVKKTPNGWQACCPAHDDKKASLSISVNEGKILLHDHGGCEPEIILDKIGLKLKDLFLEPKTRPPKPEIVAKYDYHDESGKLLFETVRFFPKDFRQRHPDGKGSWLWNLKDVRLVPYPLPQLLKASSVFIVEGEKDADNLAKIGLTATCNPMGAGKWHAEWSKFFEGKEVTILPDLDEPGRKHALDVGKKLFGHALRIKIIELPQEKGGKDVSDWLSRGGTKDDLLKLAKEAKEWLPPGTKPPKPVLKTITAEALEDKDFPELRWAVPGLLTEGLTILAGRPKKGKSWMGLGFAVAIASGGIALGKIKVEKGDVLYLALEDNERRLKSRLAKIKVEGSRLPAHLHLVTDFPPLQMGGMQVLTDCLGSIETTAQTYPALLGDYDSCRDIIGLLGTGSIDLGGQKGHQTRGIHAHVLPEEFQQQYQAVGVLPAFFQALEKPVGVGKYPIALSVRDFL